MIRNLMSKSRRLINHLQGTQKMAKPQASIDAYRAALLLKCHEWHLNSDNRHTSNQPSEDDVSDFYKEIEAMDDEDRREYAQETLNKQVISLFRAINSVYGQAAPSSKEIDDNDEVSKLRRRHGSISRNPHSSDGITSLVDAAGFEVECRNSACPSADAGVGLFMKCPSGVTVPPGTVVAIFPGLVHLPEYTQKKGYIQDNLLPDPDFQLILREDNTIIDSRTASECPNNPFALGQFVNHVPEGGTPNVLQYPYDFPGDPMGFDQFPPELCGHIPHSYAKKPTLWGTIDRSALMRSMLLISARPLRDGDEILMDYRLSGEDLPQWYHHYDTESFSSEVDQKRVGTTSGNSA